MLTCVSLDIFFSDARREEENYQRHKEQKKLGAVSYVGTAGEWSH